MMKISGNAQMNQKKVVNTGTNQQTQIITRNQGMMTQMMKLSGIIQPNQKRVLKPKYLQDGRSVRIKFLPQHLV